MTSAPDLERFERQILLSGWGAEGQRRLAAARVAVVGAGGLGSPVSIYLASAGVGEIVVVDGDRVAPSNLNRQILHRTADLGLPKARSAARTLAEVNPSVRVTAVEERLDAGNAGRILEGAAVVADCLDNMETRYVLNDHAIRTGTPLVHAGVRGWTGQMSFLRPPATPCLRCFFPEGPPPGAVPIVGATSGVLGTLQAMEILKHLVGIGRTLEGRLLVLDGEEMRIRVFEIRRAPGCPACGGVAR